MYQATEIAVYLLDVFHLSIYIYNCLLHMYIYLSI